MLKEGLKCVLYIRVSTEMQVDGYSLEAQKTVLTHYAEREGMIIKKIYTDAGKSGKTIEGRPAFCEMLDDISSGLNIDYVLVYKLSRFGRSTVDILNSIEYLQSYDINLIATADGIDSSQASGKLMISVLSALSEMERDNISEQTMNGRKEKARQGLWGGGFAPFGYKLINGQLHVIPEEAKLVRYIYDLFINNNLGSASIATELNNKGILKPSLRDNDVSLRWNYTTIKRILQNVIYTGKIIYLNKTKKKIKGQNKYIRVKNNNPIISQGKHEAIISEEIFEKAQEILRKNKQNKPGQKFKPKFMLAGILRCPICGKKLRVNYHKKDSEGNTLFYEYSCLYHRKNTATFCTNDKKIISYEIDSYVSNMIVELIKTNKLEKMVSKNIRMSTGLKTVNNNIEDLQNNISDYEIKRDKLEEDIDNLLPRDPRYEASRKRLNDRLLKINEKLDTYYEQLDELTAKSKALSRKDITTEKVLKCLENFNLIFDKMDIYEKGDLLRLFIDEINFDYNSGKISSIKFKFPIEYDLTYPNMNLEQYFETTYVVSNSPVFLKEFERTYVNNKTSLPTVRFIRSHEYTRKQPTYKKIQDYVFEKYGLKVSSGNIAEVKRKNGVAMQNSRLQEDCKHPNTPLEKYKAIEDALQYYNVIE